MIHQKPYNSLRSVDSIIMKQSLEQSPQECDGVPSTGGFRDVTGQDAR